MFAKILLAFTGLFVSIVLAVYLYPPLVAVCFTLSGRSPVCSISQAFSAAQAMLRYRSMETRFMAKDESGFKLLAQDQARYHQWQTPEGAYWIPAGSDGVLPALVAQQSSNIYGVGQNGVKPGDLVLDCGAHVGVFTRKALRAGAKLVVCGRLATQ